MKPIIAKQAENKKLLVPAGTYQAVCNAVWDLGNQKSTWGGVDVPKHKIYIRWELNLLIEEEGEYNGKRYVIGQLYNLILAPKSNLYKHLMSWRGKEFNKEEFEGFDVTTVLGANCLISVVHNEGNDGRIWANVGSIVPLLPDMEKMTPECPADEPEWVKEKQANQYSVSDVPEYNAEEAYQASDPHHDSPPADHPGMPPHAEDDLPF